MNKFESGQALLTHALRDIIGVIRETQQRVLTAETTQDEEAVHDFRVALRRCRTMLRVARNILNTKRLARIEKALQYYAQTTGSLRDDEVLRQTLAAVPLPETSSAELNAWLETRAIKGRWGQRAILHNLSNGPSDRTDKSGKGKNIRPLDVALEELEHLLDRPAKACSVQELTTSSLEKAIYDVQRGAQSDACDVDAMHTLRIREKRLRYTVELFSSVLGEDEKHLGTHATRMQRRLGDLHDVDEAISTIRQARRLTASTRSAILTALEATRVACAAKVEPHLIEARALQLPLALSRNDSSIDSPT